jgi:hypothetical protein
MTAMIFSSSFTSILRGLKLHVHLVPLVHDHTLSLMSKIDLESSSASEEATVSQLITKLNTGDKKECSPRETELLSRFLLHNLHTKQRREHWYCKRAPALLREVATYCQVWLVASQESQLVLNWKQAHSRILASCIDCVKGMEDALLGSQFTYVCQQQSSPN